MLVPRVDSHFTSAALPINSCISPEESSVIFWTPTTAITSCRRDDISDQAILSPTALEAHAASTLKVGLGLRPRYSDTTPAGDLCLSEWGAEQTTDPSIDGDSNSASSSALLYASNASSRRAASLLFPNFECPTPTIAIRPITWIPRLILARALKEGYLLLGCIASLDSA